MGKQDIIQVLTPDHTLTATFLDEDGTVGDLLYALGEVNEAYQDEWILIEVPMPRMTSLSYHELFALDQGAIPLETPVREIQERHAELINDYPDATVFKIVHPRLTLPVLFRHVPTVPESHYRQLHVLPTMTTRQVLDVVIKEMGLKALDAQHQGQQQQQHQKLAAQYIISHVRINHDGTEEEKQLADGDKPFEILMENRQKLMNQEIKDYQFLFTIPDSWISRVESVTSRITGGWTSSARPLSMALYNLFGNTTTPGAGSDSTGSKAKEISAPIPIATTSIHHPSNADALHRAETISDFHYRAPQLAGGAKDSGQKKRQSMYVGSRLSALFDPSTLGGWLAPDTKKRHSIVFGSSTHDFFAKPAEKTTMFAGGVNPELYDMTDEELDETFEALLNDLNIKDSIRASMLQFPREKKLSLIQQNQQLQEHKERIISPEPHSQVNNSNHSPGSISAATGRILGANANNQSKYKGTISSRVSFIEPDSTSFSQNNMGDKRHSRYSSWSSMAGSVDGVEEDGRPTSSLEMASGDRPMSPTLAAAGSLLSSLFGGSLSTSTSTGGQQHGFQDEVQQGDTPQFYIEQLMSKTISQQTLAKHLLSLRVALSTAKLSWTRQFLESGKGFRALENVLDKSTVKRRGAGRSSDLDETLQSECVQCLRVLMNTEPGFAQVLRSPSLVAHIAYCLYTNNNKLRAKVAEVLAALCVMTPESHRLVLIALSDFRVAHEERFRFEYLVETLATPIAPSFGPDSGGEDTGFGWEYKTACMSLMNALVNSPSSLDDRIALGDELRRRGLEDVIKSLQQQNPPESLVIQINVYEEERHEDKMDLQERIYAASKLEDDQGQVSDPAEELVDIIRMLPKDNEMYSRVMRVLHQFAHAGANTLKTPKESLDESEETEEDDSDNGLDDLIANQDLQFKQDLWTIFEKFGEYTFDIRDFERDWGRSQDDFLESIQYIVGKRGIVLTFSNPSLAASEGSSHSASASSTYVASSGASSMSTGSYMSSARQTYIDYELDSLHRELEEVREESEGYKRQVTAARKETEQAKALVASMQKSNNHAGLVQRLVQKEKEVTQLREAIEKMEKKYNIKADLSMDEDIKRPERLREIDSTRWNAMLAEVEVQKSKTAQATTLADDRQKEINYLKRALLIVCQRYEKAVGERVPDVMDDDTRGPMDRQHSERALQLSSTFEALARKDEEIIGLKNELEQMRTDKAQKSTPVEEIATLRSNLKEINQRVQELQFALIERDNQVKTLKEQLYIYEAAKLSDDKNGVSQGINGPLSPNGAETMGMQQQQLEANGAGRVERSHTRGSLKLQIRALSAKGWQAMEEDEEQEGSVQDLAVQSPLSQARSGPLSPRPRPLGAGVRRPALPPPPPPPGPRHRQFEEAAAAAITAAASAASAQAPPGTPTPSNIPPPPPPPPATLASRMPAEGEAPPPSNAPEVANVTLPPPAVSHARQGAPPPPPPPQPPFVRASTKEDSANIAPPIPEASTPNTPNIPPPPPPPPVISPASTPVPTAQPPTVATSVPNPPAGIPTPPPPPPLMIGATPSSTQSLPVQPSAVPSPSTVVSTPKGSIPPPPPPPGSARGGGIPPPPPLPAPAGAGGPPPPPPPPPKSGSSGAIPSPPAFPSMMMPKVIVPPPEILQARPSAPGQPAPPPPPPPPGLRIGGQAPNPSVNLEGAIPTLPVFTAGTNRIINPPKPQSMALPQTARPSRPMKQLFWNKLPSSTISQTVWRDICDPSSDLDIVDLDYTEIEELFCKNQPASTANKQPEKKKTLSLFPNSRAQNISIMLSRIKLPHSDIRAAILEILDDKLNVENLKAIKQYVPTSDEIELVREYEGDFDTLSSADRFYREIHDIPRLSERLTAMVYRRRLEMEVAELSPEMEVLRCTVLELRSSKKLKRLLKTVLVIGNHMNGSSFRGNAYGFQLEALMKMRDTKGIEGMKVGGSSLLHYLAKSVHDKDPTLLTFIDELPHLEAAARMSFQSVLATIQSLVNGMKLISEEIQTLSQITVKPPNDKFIEVMQTFVESNEQGVVLLNEAGQSLEQDLKKLLMYYGEDPVNTKPEDFFGMLVSFSTMLQKAQADNEAMVKKLSKQTTPAKNRRPTVPVGGVAITAIRDGHLDDAIRGLKSGLRRTRRERPMSHLYSELSMEALQAMSVPRSGHSRHGSRAQ